MLFFDRIHCAKMFDANQHEGEVIGPTKAAFITFPNPHSQHLPALSPDHAATRFRSNKRSLALLFLVQVHWGYFQAFDVNELN